jgi:uncharacterized protein YggE
MKSILLAAALALPLMAGAGARAESVTDGSTLHISAAGETRLAPDRATISLGVETTAAEAGEAVSANAQRMTRVLSALKSAGIAPADMRTSTLSLNPQYAYEQGQSPRLTGYQASNQLTVTVTDLSKLGGVVDAVTKAGATNVGQIEFGVSDRQSAEDAARRAAVKALQAKAALYAEATGYRIGRLIRLDEGGFRDGGPRPVPMVAMASPKSAPTPVQAGEISATVEISAVYELARP